VKKSVVVVYYSFSTQTAKLVHRLRKGFRQAGFEVETLKIVPEKELSFPLYSIPKTIFMMITTFLRKRIGIRPVDKRLIESANLVVIAGPTWSYNPSGPILDFLDRYSNLLKAKDVLPVISCRKYWRAHFNYLKGKIESAGGRCMGPIVFTHNIKEPWSTVGTFMTIAGINPRSFAFMRRYYPRYGHNHEQLKQMEQQARTLAMRLYKRQGEPTSPDL